MSSRRRAALRDGTAFLLYLALSLALFGPGVLDHLESATVGDAGTDRSVFIWSLAWWPHALSHGQDPYVTHAVWAPHGLGLAWTTTVAGPSLLAWPLTAAFGPILTYNLLMLAAPALAAFTAYRLCRFLARETVPALVGGVVFGFSSYLLGHLLGHLNLVLVFCVPLAAHLVLRHRAGEISTRRLALTLGPVLALQLATSSEIAFTLTLLGVTALALSLWRLPAERPRLWATARASALAYAVGFVLSLPFVVHALFVGNVPGNPIQRSSYWAADVASYVVPSRLLALRPPFSSDIATRFTGSPAEQGGYLGLPIVAIVVLFALERPRSRARGVALLLLALAVLASLGPWVRVAGTRVLIGPWAPLAKLPISRHVLPVRLTMFVALFAGAIVAVWLAEAATRRARIGRFVLAACGLAAMVPAAWNGYWRAALPDPAFFRDGAYRAVVARGETVLVTPFGVDGQSQTWQAQSDMYFRLAGGYLTPVPPERERRYAILPALYGAPAPASAGTELARFLRDHDVRQVLVAPGTKPSVAQLLAAGLAAPRRVADVLVYDVRP